jgi:hypothetical protein
MQERSICGTWLCHPTKPWLMMEPNGDCERLPFISVMCTPEQYRERKRPVAAMETYGTGPALTVGVLLGRRCHGPNQQVFTVAVRNQVATTG